MTSKVLTSVKATAQNVLSDNKANAILVARVEVGKTVMMQTQKRLESVLPIFLRGYAKNKYFGLVLANVFVFVQKFYLPGNEKAVLLTDCVLKAATFELGASFDIPTVANSYIDKAFAGFSLEKLGLGGGAASAEGAGTAE
jgi:hypothetical protein